MTYVERVLDDLKKRNPGETEFHQTATEMLLTLEPVINAPPRYDGWEWWDTLWLIEKKLKRL